MMRPELDPLPPRMRVLPVDARGYPVPWFVATINGVPDHRVADREKWVRAVKERRCWVCGIALGVHVAFVIGPMCGINRTTSDPPSHLECAEWAAKNCPFLSRPRAKRRDDEFTRELANHVAGEPILRNPGLSMVWVTRSYRLFRAHKGNTGYLIEIGEPERVTWFAERRPATREEVLTSIESGFPLLMDMATAEESLNPGCGAVAELTRRAQAFERFYPVA